MHAQTKAADPSKGYMALILELLKQAQTHVVNRKRTAAGTAPEEEGAEGENDVTAGVTLEVDISLKNDEKLQSLLEVIAHIQRKLVVLGEDSVLTCLSTLEG